MYCTLFIKKHKKRAVKISSWPHFCGVRKAIIGFHGETVTELCAGFEAAIDFMIEDCKARQRNARETS
jgi:predicted RNase H-like HicB family nuclease